MIKKENMKQWLILIITGVLVFWAINNLNNVFDILKKVINVLSPFILGIVLAFIINIPMKKIELLLSKILKDKKSTIRVISIVLSLLIVLLIISITFFLLIPEIIDNIESLVSTFPELINKIEAWLLNLLEKYPSAQTEIKNIFANNTLETLIPTLLNYIVNSAITLITNIVNGIITIFMGIVFSIYILSQKESLMEGFKKITRAYLNKELSDKIIDIFKLTNKTFNKFVTGQCLEAVILGTIFFVVLSIFKFPYALLISVLTTITALIPIFGALIAMVIGAILIAIESPIQSLIFIAVFQVIQQIEGNIIYPKVVGKSVGLSPLWTLLAITVGGSLFGIIGMLTSIPLASILYTLLKENMEKRLTKNKKKTIKD